MWGTRWTKRGRVYYYSVGRFAPPSLPLVIQTRPRVTYIKQISGGNDTYVYNLTQEIKDCTADHFLECNDYLKIDYCLVRRAV